MYVPSNIYLRLSFHILPYYIQQKTNTYILHHFPIEWPTRFFHAILLSRNIRRRKSLISVADDNNVPDTYKRERCLFLNESRRRIPMNKIDYASNITDCVSNIKFPQYNIRRHLQHRMAQSSTVFAISSHIRTELLEDDIL